MAEIDCRITPVLFYRDSVALLKLVALNSRSDSLHLRRGIELEELLETQESGPHLRNGESFKGLDRSFERGGTVLDCTGNRWLSTGRVNGEAESSRCSENRFAKKPCEDFCGSMEMGMGEDIVHSISITIQFFST